MGNVYTYEFDIHKKELVSDCKLYPTDVLHNKCPWLWARNNKYENVNPAKIGKWMLFLSKDKVNAVWDKVKMAVANGELWDTKVSTSNPQYITHVIIIYTKDYTDVDDVIHVLNYLESSEIKPSQVTIYYKTDQQTHAGIYSGGEKRPWIYSSATIQEKESAADCKSYPSDIRYSDTPWLFAKNYNKYENVDSSKVGKWMLFVSKDKVNEVWDKIKMGVASGDLWDTKVSTNNPKHFTHAIMIYTKDYTDLDDVIRVLNYLENSEIKSPQVTIYYKTDQQTHAGVYSGGEKKPWIYSSATIHEAAVASAPPKVECTKLDDKCRRTSNFAEEQSQKNKKMKLTS